MSQIGPVLPPGWKSTASSDHDDEHPEATSSHEDLPEDSYGPALPPELLESASVDRDDEESDDDVAVGPLPASTSESEEAYLKRLERLHQEKEDEEEIRNRRRNLIREEWMTELPTKLSRSYGLAARSFKKNDSGTSGDSSAWTETPEERQQRHSKPGDSKEKDEKAVLSKADAERDRKYDQEVARLNNKRSNESLVDMHLKKHKQDKESEKEKGVKTERRPFDREQDMKMPKLQSATDRQSTMNKAKQYGSRFEHGSSRKYL